MQSNRVYMHVMLMSDEMTAYWMIFNSTDLKNLLVLILADIDLSCDDLFLNAWRIWQTTVNMNSVAVAQFFHQICVTGYATALYRGLDAAVTDGAARRRCRRDCRWDCRWDCRRDCREAGYDRGASDLRPENRLLNEAGQQPCYWYITCMPVSLR